MYGNNLIKLLLIKAIYDYFTWTSSSEFIDIFLINSLSSFMPSTVTSPKIEFDELRDARDVRRG